MTGSDLTGSKLPNSAGAIVLASVILVSLFAIGFVATGTAMAADAESLPGGSAADVDNVSTAQSGDSPIYHLEFNEPGKAYAFGIPAPSDQTFGEAFNESFEGSLYRYETGTGWVQITNADRELNAQEGYLLILTDTADPVDITLEVQETSIPLPGERNLTEGWNFITPTRQDHLENAFEVSEDVFTILNAFEQPSVSPGYQDAFVSSQINLGEQPIVDPFTGYFVSASGGLIFSDVNTDMTQQEADEALNIDSDLAAPYFDVDITNYDEGVAEGETVTVEYQVTNTGDRGATQDIEVLVDGTVEETHANVTLYGGGTFNETFTYQTGSADAPGIDVEVSTENESASQGITVLSAALGDQATASSTIADTETAAGVVVENVDSNVDSAILVTYVASGAEVVAGVETFTATELDGSDLAISIADTGGFPGNHTAHIVPVSDLSGNYAPGDTLSTATAEAAVSQATARVYQGTVTFDDQIYENETTQVEVATSNLQLDGDAEYVVVVHEMSGGTVGSAIGHSAVLTGQHSDVTIDIDPINATGNYTAMLHEQGSPVGPGIPNADAAEGFVAGNVADAAEISIYQEQLAITDAPATIQRGDYLSGAVNATVTADEVTTASTTQIQVDLVFEGLPGEAETVLGSETVELAAGESTTVTFTNLDPIPNATVATDGEPVNLRVEANTDTAFTSTALDHPIQQAVGFAQAGETVRVLAGTYEEQVLVNKDLTIQGESGATVAAPDVDNRSAFTLPETDATDDPRTVDPIVFGFGGDLAGTDVTGNGTIQLSITNLTVDGMQRSVNSGADYFGVALRNANGGVYSSVVDNMTTGGTVTGGIGIFGASDLGIHDNEVLQYERIGIVAAGNDTEPPYPSVRFENNTVRGPGEPVGGWAPNGVQISYGASGLIANNTITGNQYENSNWIPGGVVVYMSEDVAVHDNVVRNNSGGIQIGGDTFFGTGQVARNTTVTGNLVEDQLYEGIKVNNKTYDTVITENYLRNNNVGFKITGPDASVDNLSFNWNNIVGNGDGVINHYDHQLNATYNWWGDDSGPSGEGPGTGDSVSVNVTYDPWLNSTFDDGTAATDDLSVEFTSPPANAQRETTVTAEAEVTRSLEVATQSGSLVTVEYLIDGEVVATEDVDVSTGDTKTVTFQDVPVPGSATAAAPDNPEAVDQTVRLVGDDASDTVGLNATNPLQHAIDYAGAENIDTVDARPGNYSENVSVSTPDLTVVGPNAGTHGADSRASEATIDGRVTIDANGVVFDGFDVSPPNATENQNAEAVLVSGSADDVVVRNNVVRDFGEDSLDQWQGVDGIVAFGGDGTTAATNVTIVDNLVQGISGRDTDGGATGISIQGNVQGATVRDNVVTDIGRNETAWAFGLVVRATGNHDVLPGNVDLRSNDVSRVYSNQSTDTVGVGLGSEGDASEMTVRENSIADVELLAENKDENNTLDIRRNWWGDVHGPNTTENPLETDAGPLGGAGDITYTPWLDAPADQGGQPVAAVENVDSGTFYLSLQNAVDNASTGHTLEARTGTYPEEVSITVDGLTIQGVQSGGTGEDPTLEGEGGNGITVDASDVTVRNVSITGYGNGIRLTGAHANITFANVESVANGNRGMAIRNDADLQNLLLDGVNFSANAGDGIRAATESSIDGFTVRNSQFNDHLNAGSSGMEIYQSEENPGQLNDVIIEDTVIKNNWQKGIYTEKLSNATLRNVTIDGVVSDTYGFNNGIDINLKYADYENVTVRDSTVANVTKGDPSDPLFSSAVAVKARDDPTAYDDTPATLDDVTFDNVTVADSYNGLRVGEPGVNYSASPSGPTNVLIQNSAFIDNAAVHVADVPKDRDLDAILNDQGNAFDPGGVIIREEDFDAIAPEVTSSDAIEVSTADELRDAASGELVTPDSVVQPGAEIVVVDNIDLGNEGVEVLVEDVTIRSEVGQQFSVSLTPDSATSEKTFRVNADGVTMRDLTVVREGAPDRDDNSQFAHGIVIRNDTGEKISDVRMESVRVVGSGLADQNNRGVQVLDGTGTATADAANITVVDSSVTGFDGGLSAAAPYGGNVSQVTFDNNVIEGHRVGIDASTLAADFQSSGGNVTNVTVTNNVFGTFAGGAFPVLEIANETDGTIEVLDFRSIFESNGNVFDTGVLTFSDAANDQVRTFTNPNFPGVEFAGISADIQTSVDVSEPGDTVEVLPGTYTESVEVPAGRTVTGPNAGLAGDDSSRGPEARIEGTVNLDEATVFEGFEVSDDGTSVLKINPLDPGLGEVEIRSNVLLPQDPDNTHAVEYTTGVTRLVVENNLVDGQPLTGILVATSDATVSASDNVFQGGATAGIFVADGQTDQASLSLQGNDFVELPYGVLLGTSESATLTVEFPTFDTNQFQAGSDIAAYVSDPFGRIDASSTGIGLPEIRDNNAYDPDAVLVEADNEIVPETAVNVTNVDQRTGYADVQTAVDAAETGDTLEVATGEYSFADITTDGLTLAGAGMDATVLTGTQLNINATDVTLRDVEVDAPGLAIGIRPGQAANGLHIENVKITEKSDTTIGLSISANGTEETAVDRADGLHVENFSVSGASVKGIYLERATNATLQDITVDGIPYTGNENPPSNGIDINLKYDDYENITIQDVVVRDVERDDFGNDPTWNAAIAIKSRDDGSYSGTPATLDGVTLENVTIENSTAGLRFGEPGVDYSADPAGPTNVSVQNSAFVDNEAYHVEDLPDSVDLNTVLDDNTFDPEGVVQVDRIVPSS